METDEDIGKKCRNLLMELQDNSRRLRDIDNDELNDLIRKCNKLFKERWSQNCVFHLKNNRLGQGTSINLLLYLDTIQYQLAYKFHKDLQNICSPL